MQKREGCVISLERVKVAKREISGPQKEDQPNKQDSSPRLIKPYQAFGVTCKEFLDWGGGWMG